MVLRGKLISDAVDRVVIQLAGNIVQRVVLATPVDTGRARGGWLAGVGSAPSGQGTKDASGGSTISRAKSGMSSRTGDQTIYISNNVVYIGRLNAGSSAQAPSNFVAQAVKAGLSEGAKFKI
jgi:hypothetical protein